MWGPPFTPPRVVNNHRTHWPFEEGNLFKVSKEQIIREVEETLSLLGLSRLMLARRMNVQPSAVTQSLATDKGLQLTTLVRMADALGCDIEVNFIRRGPHTPASGPLSGKAHGCSV